MKGAFLLTNVVYLLHMEKQWKKIFYYNYEISTDGSVRSSTTGLVM